MKNNVIINDQPSKEEVQHIKDELKAYNDAIAGDDQHQELNLVMYDENHHIIAGLVGGTYWGWLDVDRLWVATNYRKKGIGKKLLQRAEEEAKKRGCHSAHLDTMSFQAPGFYLKQGYVERCCLEDLPLGYKKHVLTKKL